MLKLQTKRKNKQPGFKSALTTPVLEPFADCYRRQCQQIKIYPLPFVITPAFHHTFELKVPGDKITAHEDWEVLLYSIENATDLRSITIWSTWWHESR
jgi:hypothetical protein